MRFHLLPETDAIPHETAEDCLCGPFPRWDEGGHIVVVHHPLSPDDSALVNGNR